MSDLEPKKDSVPDVEPVRLRTAEMSDARILLSWRNDPETRRQSHQSEIVTVGEHMEWLSLVLEDPDRRLYVAESDGRPVGTVRCEREGEVWKLSWTVAPSARGQRIGTRMVQELVRSLGGPVSAEILKGNIGSSRIAEKVGMTLRSEADGTLFYSSEVT